MSDQDHMSDEDYMRECLALADQAASWNEVPVGAIVVRNNEIIGRGFNQPISSGDPSAHAEMMAIRDAAKTLNNYRMPGARLYVTVEPCTMCAGVIIHARIAHLIYGTKEPRSGAVHSHKQVLEGSHLNHIVEVSQIDNEDMMTECATKMTDFFRRRRSSKTKSEVSQVEVPAK